MRFEELAEFVEKRMTMSHIYQPLLIRALLDAGGSATLRQLALAFVGQDESQLIYYEKRIKEMPVRVLKRHGVVESAGSLVKLNVGRLSFEQKATLRMLCEQRLQGFLQKRGLATWDYRLLDTEPVPDSLRYQVLKQSGGRCALCGTTKEERPLDVDHIIPRARGGPNTLANMQVLCSKCNRSKRDLDDTDFRSQPPCVPQTGCPFCAADRVASAIAKNRSVYAIRDKYPVTEGHTLVIPLRHTLDYLDMTSLERHDAEDLVRYLSQELKASDPTVEGINIGVNCGEVAGQTVFHAHIHLIPRRKGDTPRPRGGVRGVIPEKMAY